MSLFDEPKIDAHCHVLDPARFAYADDVAYRPAGQELAPLAQYREVMQAYGIRHALLVGPNSGYGLDNRCLLDALAQGAKDAQGRAAPRFHGIAVVRNDIGRAQLLALRDAGVIGVAWNATLLGVEHYLQATALLRHLADLDMCLSLQVEHDQLVTLAPPVMASGVRVLVDHCGRPRAGAGLRQPGFQALLALARSGRVAVKLSGLQKFSLETPPHDDALPFVRALLDAFGLDACLWASDWPFLKAPQRIDMGPLLLRVQALLPDAADRARLWWHTPRRWLGFASEPSAMPSASTL